jgi:hypothetical protein
MNPYFQYSYNINIGLYSGIHILTKLYSWIYFNTGCLKKELYNSIPNVTVWRVLRKRWHLKAYKLSTLNDG